MTDKYIFDVEIYRNFFSVIFQNLESKLDTQTFVIWKDRNDKQALVDFLAEPKILIGFNNINFDSAILNAICNSLTLKETWDISQQIVNGKEDRNISQLRWQNVPYKSVDLMRIMAFDTQGISLKIAGIKLRWNRIEELPIPYDSLIETQEQVDTLLDYNFNDVLITSLLYRKIENQIELRQGISELYKVDVISASESRIGSLVLEHLYHELTGIPKNVFTNTIGSPRDKIKLSDCIPNNINFETRELKSFLSGLKDKVLKNEEDFRLGDLSIFFDDKQYNIGVGGLHSDDSPGIFKSDENVKIMDADVASYYLLVIINNQIKPTHLREEYHKIPVILTDERLSAKRAGESVKASALKITALSTIFGKLRNKHFWTYDPLAFYKVTIIGQLYLLMLIEALSVGDIKTISANTDGIVCKVEKNKEEIYKQVCSDWMKKLNLELEFAQYDLYVRNNVNNYLAIKDAGKVKTKGLFYNDDFYEDNKFEIKGMGNPSIISKSLYHYYVNKGSIEEYINGCNDIYEFFMFQKIQKKFTLWYEDLNGKKELQRTTRFYASQKGGDLYKLNNEKRISLCADNPVLPLNDVPQNVEDFYIDKQYYIREVQKIIDNIEPPIRNNSLF